MCRLKLLKGGDPVAREIRSGFSLTKRLFVLAAIAFLPALVIVARYEFDVRSLREAEIRQLALRTAQNAASEVDRIFEGVENLLRAVSYVPAVSRFDMEGCGAYLRALETRVPSLKMLWGVDITGRVVCHQGGPPDEPRHNGRDYFRDVLAGKRFAIGTALATGPDGIVVLPVAVPIVTPNGAAGAVVAGLDLRWLRERLRERALIDGAELTLADREGVILFHEPSDRNLVGSRIPDEFRRLVYAEEASVQEIVLDDGRRRVMAFLPASVTGGLYVSASLLHKTAFAPVNHATRNSIALAALGLLLALGATWIATRVFIQRPVRQVLAAVQAWRNGRDDARTHMNPAEGEFEAIGAAFDKLLDEVQSRQAEAAQAARARAESEERYRSLIELSPDAEFVDVDSRIVFTNTTMLRLLGADAPEQVLGRSSLEFIAPEYRDEVRQRIETLKHSGQPNPPMEQRWLRLDGTPVHVEVVSARIPWEGGHANQVILRDIAGRKRAEERQRLLLHELNHRVKNTLATVQSLVLQTLRTASSLPEFRTSFMGRLLALSATHNLLTEREWDHASLAELLWNELKPYGGERVTLSGRDLVLPPRIVLPLGMVFHELATNAAKYGALSAAGGRVHVSWSSEARADVLALEWREEGGPPPGEPGRSGFGSRLLERTLSGELAGRYERSFTGTGMVCRLGIPLTTAGPSQVRHAA